MGKVNVLVPWIARLTFDNLLDLEYQLRRIQDITWLDDPECLLRVFRNAEFVLCNGGIKRMMNNAPTKIYIKNIIWEIRGYVHILRKWRSHAHYEKFKIARGIMNAADAVCVGPPPKFVPSDLGESSESETDVDDEPREEGDHGGSERSASNESDVLTILLCRERKASFDFDSYSLSIMFPYNDKWNNDKENMKAQNVPLRKEDLKTLYLCEGIEPRPMMVRSYSDYEMYDKLKKKKDKKHNFMRK